MNAATEQSEPRSSVNAHLALQKSTMISLWEAVDLCLLREGIDSSATSDERPSPFGDTTKEAASQTESGWDIDVGSARGNTEGGEKITKNKQGGEISTSAEETPCENDDAYERDDSTSDPDSDGEDGEEASDGSEDEEYCGRKSSDDEYKTDKYCEHSSSQEDDASSRRSAASPTNGGGSHHELFLPCDIHPSTESLKYEESDESSGEEDDAPPTSSSYPTYKIGNSRSGRPRLWDGCPSSVPASSGSSSDETRRSNGPGDAKLSKRGRISFGSPRISDGCPPCVSTSSESSSEESQTSVGVKDDVPSKRGGISFSDSVTVFPIFELDAYPPSVVESMYTGSKELRQNRIRNLREYAHDKRDWRNATEEDDMDFNEEGELVHPAHQPACSKRNVVQIHPPSHLRSVDSSQAGRRGKRMRMWYS